MLGAVVILMDESTETEITRGFGVWMREKLSGRTLTQEAVARGTGLGKSTISRYARGVAVPTPAVAVRLAYFFEVSVDEVFEVAGIRASTPAELEWLSMIARAEAMEGRLGELGRHMEAMLKELSALRADVARLERARAERRADLPVAGDGSVVPGPSGSPPS